MFYIARRVDFEGEPNNDANGARYLHFGVLSKLGGLAAALARGPHHCALVFPKIIGSTLGNYETFSVRAYCGIGGFVRRRCLNR